MQEVVIPVLGQSVEEAEIVQWFKAEGDSVSEGEPLFSVQTDKAEIEVESTASGTLRKILVDAGDEVPVKSVAALVGAPDEELPDLSQYERSGDGAAKESAASPAAAAPVSEQPAVSSAPQPTVAAGAGVSPRARRAAEKHHIDAVRLAGRGAEGRVMESDVRAYAETLEDVRISPTARRIAAKYVIDVSSLQGSGPQGRIMKADVLEAVERTPTAQPVSTEGVTRAPLSPMRRTIADRMSASKFSAPHYYVTVEVDMAAVRDYRASLSFKASYNHILLLAVAKTLQEFPQVNARWAGDAIEQVADINLGMAVALEGGLVVPVIQRAETRSLEDLASESRRLAEKAQQGRLLPDDYAGNTFTVSNLGAFGVDHFTAIINPPDSAILAVGQIAEKPAVVDGDIVVRPLMKLTMSSDHRVIDGAVAAQFLGRLKERLESAEF